MTNAQYSKATDPVIRQQEAQLRESDPDLLVESLTNKVDDAKLRDSQGAVPAQWPKHPYRFVPLRMGGGGRTHVPSSASAALMEEVSLEDLQDMTDRFYEKAFQDDTLDKFIRSHNDPHGARFAKWIHSKLSGSSVWDQDRATRSKKPVRVAGGRMAVVHDRTSAHAAAWYSPKRPKEEVGRHFELDEARVWMRLHFWALRESGMLDKSPSFADYYIRFIAHFVRVYESTAPMFARDSFRWSADPTNIDKYLKDGRKMKDVLGFPFHVAVEQIPASESEDFDWPYNETEEEFEGQAW